MNKFLFEETGSDNNFMPEVLTAERLREKRSASLLLGFVALVIIVLLLWAHFAEIDEVARGEGRVIPSSKLQVIDHLEGGIIKEIAVREGDTVEQGQLLLRIDNTIALARFQEEQILYYRRLAEVARLRAQIAGKEFVIPKEVRENAPEEGEEAMRQYRSHLEDLQSEVAIATREMQQRAEELRELQSRTVELSRQLELIQNNIKKIEPLVKRSLEPEITLNDLRIRESELRAEIASLRAKIARAKTVLGQSEEKLKQVPIKFKANDFNLLQEANNRLASVRGAYKSETDRFTRTEVRSPVHGIVKQLLISTVGGVVQPGEDLLEVVPLEDTLLVEAKMSPQDIAFLRPGLKASIKITAYDFSIYGDLDAELVRVSADSITDEEGNVFYRAYLRTENTKLSRANEDLPIIPGMIAVVDVITGKKSILDYIMKPILKAQERAMTER